MPLSHWTTLARSFVPYWMEMVEDLFSEVAVLGKCQSFITFHFSTLGNSFHFFFWTIFWNNLNHKKDYCSACQLILNCTHSFQENVLKHFLTLSSLWPTPSMCSWMVSSLPYFSPKKERKYAKTTHIRSVPQSFSFLCLFIIVFNGWKATKKS